MKIYKVGDTVPGVGKIESNHCGFPWLAGMKGLYCGVLQVGEKFIDAKTGKVLTQGQVRFRLNNKKFDYENRAHMQMSARLSVRKTFNDIMRECNPEEIRVENIFYPSNFFSFLGPTLVGKRLIITFAMKPRRKKCAQS